MDRNEALQILNLGKNASRSQIEKRFENLSRRVKNGEDLEYDSIEKAYNLLIDKEAYNRNDSKLMAAYRKFMFHYKGWAILILISVVIFSMVLIPMIFRRVPDLTISFAGRYGEVDLDIMDQILQENMPQTEDILIEVIYLDEEGESGEFDYGGRTRLTGLLISEEADILIVDDSTFNYIRSDNALMALDNLITEFSVEIPEENFIYGVNFDTGEKMIYGISVADKYLIYRSVYGEYMRILCIAERTTHIDDIIKAIEIIITYGSE